MASTNFFADAARKVLGIDHQEPQSPSGYLPHDAFIDPYEEPEPTVGEWFRSLIPTKEGPLRYARSIFLFAEWLPRYNLTWLLGDSVAGLTVGFVVIPQAMAYALLADLSPEYGLYTSFVGAALYWIFGTSKDIVIGTTAVGSLLVGSVITAVQEQRPGIYTNEDIAKALSAVSGMILLFIGLVRLGWIIEFIPYIPISAFVTGASITIMSTQFPVAMGISGINTREAPYLVIINSLKGLPRTRVDAAIGLSSIALLFAIRYLCAKMEVRQPAKKMVWAMISSLRLTFAMLLYTLISWLVNRNNSGPSPFRIVGKIEKGFKHAGAPPMDQDLLKLVLPKLPAVVIILVIEHIAIAKSFGRIFNYTVVPSQEILAQGASNLIGTFVGGYVCTGSFGASAVLSKAGVRTPLAGLFSAVILVLALHVLTSVFYYIPNAALAGLIIHAVVNLPTPPRTLYKYWRLSPPDFFIWVIGVVLAIFTDLEISIYVTICVSLALFLLRNARTKGQFLGQTSIYHLPDNETDHSAPDSAGPLPRPVYLPLTNADGSNPSLPLTTPHPGVFIYRLPAPLSYLNQSQHMHRLVEHVKAHTRPGNKDAQQLDRSQRLWSDPGPSRAGVTEKEAGLPTLRAVVIDCAAVGDGLDVTSVQGLVDARAALERWAGQGVAWHFAGIDGRWARRALGAGGFGVAEGGKDAEKGERGWYPVGRPGDGGTREKESSGEETSTEGGREGGGKWVPIWGLHRPRFHVDLGEAVQAATWDAKRAEEREAEARR